MITQTTAYRCLSTRSSAASLRDRKLLRAISARCAVLLDEAEVRPLDDADLLAAADSRKASTATMKARDDAIVRNALAGGEPLVVVVLGGGHDFTESIRAQNPRCGYIRVAMKKVLTLFLWRNRACRAEDTESASRTLGS
jgi:hypothetical protein